MKCTDCKWFKGWIKSITGKDTKYGLCGALREYDIIDKGSAEDDNLECDLYADLRDGNAAEGDQ